MSRHMHGLPWVRSAELIQKAKLENVDSSSFADERRPDDFRKELGSKKSKASKTSWLLGALVLLIVVGQLAIAIALFS